MDNNICYLDGRIVDLALRDKGLDVLSQSKLTISLVEDGSGGITAYNCDLPYAVLKDGVNIFRTIVQSQYIRHSTLLFLDIEEKRCWWWNPRSRSDRRVVKLHAIIKTLLHDYMRKITNIPDLELVDIYQGVPDTVNTTCAKSGLCNAFVLRFLLEWMDGGVKGVNWENDIIDFSLNYNNMYKDMLTGDPDIEYDFSSRGSLMGGLGGIAIGGLVGGPMGAVVGGATGALAGGLLSPRMHDKSCEDDYGGRRIYNSPGPYKRRMSCERLKVSDYSKSDSLSLLL